MRRLADQIVKLADADGHPQTIADKGAELADHVAALDAWLTKGGFLPDAWQRKG
jgi:hypothetical protein